MFRTIIRTWHPQQVAPHDLDIRLVVDRIPALDDPDAPWGGFKYSGVGREFGRYGIEAFLEPRAILE